MDDIYSRHKKIWKEKKILREIYSQWYGKIIGDMSQVSGTAVELGGGSGNFKEFKKDIISADIADLEWLDMCFDAHEMPFGEDEISNLVMIDVFHHLIDPVKFLFEARRVLKPGGRVIMIEPFPSPFSLIIYKRFHPEPFDKSIDYFSGDLIRDGKDPWDSNQAIPYLIFFKDLEKFKEKFGAGFRILKKEKFSFILYPASGGFENRQMIPDFLTGAFKVLEKSLAPLKDFIAFRCYIVLEKL
ncbi:MAG: class I SAM-dependent methyltransferase [Bacteroidetes bacterium]|nr:class I SAM-dependent methyltransferase [Bacteroidota bacterium]